MNFDLTDGTLFMKTDDQYIKLGDNVTGTAEVEFSAEEIPPVVYNLNKTAEFTGSVDYNEELFRICNDTALNEWSLEYNVPIKIQARWHKKPRIRKKWLKRYGMKDDVVKVVCKTRAIVVSPEETYDEYVHPDGTLAEFEKIEFVTDNIEYVWRPDQKRKGIIVEV